MESGGSMLHSQGPSNNPYLSRINPIPRIDTYFFKVHSNIVLPSLLYVFNKIKVRISIVFNFMKATAIKLKSH